MVISVFEDFSFFYFQDVPTIHEGSERNEWLLHDLLRNMCKGCGANSATTFTSADKAFGGSKQWCILCWVWFLLEMYPSTKMAWRMLTHLMFLGVKPLGIVGNQL